MIHLIITRETGRDRRVRTDDEATLGADHVPRSVVLHQQGVGVIRALHLGKSISTVIETERTQCCQSAIYTTQHDMDTRTLQDEVTRHWIFRFASDLQDLCFSLHPVYTSSQDTGRSVFILVRQCVFPDCP